MKARSDHCGALIHVGALAILAFGGTMSLSHAQTVPSTFSIVACDTTNGDLGIAVASKFLAVGAVVPWAKAEIGAIATQAWANTTFGPEGLSLLEKGISPRDAIEKLLSPDEGKARRQVGIVDAKGKAWSYTGSECMKWAGGKVGQGYSVQGNILTGEEVVNAMASAFENSKGPLADRLYAALLAGEKAGGDSRGKQSAALLVVRRGGGYSGFNDRYMDLRVDDHADPVKELGRLLYIQKAISLLSEAMNLYKKGDLNGALEKARKSTELNPESGDCYYDLACYQALSGKKREALSSLAKAFSLNPAMKKMALTDGDLASLRDEPEFKKMIEK